MALFVPSLGRAASKRFVVPIPNSSGISQEHAAINALGSAVSCWHGRRDSGSSLYPRVQAPHVPPHPIASIPPRAIKLIYLSVFQPVCSWIPSSFQQLLLFQRQLGIIGQEAKVPRVRAPTARPITKSFPNTGNPTNPTEALSNTSSLLQEPKREWHKLRAELPGDFGQPI